MICPAFLSVRRAGHGGRGLFCTDTCRGVVSKVPNCTKAILRAISKMHYLKDYTVPASTNMANAKSKIALEALVLPISFFRLEIQSAILGRHATWAD